MVKRFFTLMILGIMLGGAFSSVFARTPDYSVVWNVIQNGQTFKQTMYFQGDAKVRTEMQNPAGTFTTIARRDKKVVWVLTEAQKTYMQQTVVDHTGIRFFGTGNLFRCF